jgi:hypothetical protein
MRHTTRAHLTADAEIAAEIADAARDSAASNGEPPAAAADRLDGLAFAADRFPDLPRARLVRVVALALQLVTQ